MSARNDQADESLWQGPIGEFVNGEVADDVVHAVQGLAKSRGQGLRRTNPNRQRADEARARRHADRVNLLESDACFLESRVEGRQEGLQVAREAISGMMPP